MMTVGGPIAPEQMGLTLPHEHIIVDFIGADRVARDRYDADEVIRVALPHLRRLREQGVRTLVECTPAYPGTRPDPATAIGRGQRPAPADQHRLLRRQRRQAPTCSRADRIGRGAGPTLG